MSQLKPELPAKLEEIIIKALEKDREVRYQHASELRADLSRLRRDTELGRIALSTKRVPSARLLSQSRKLAIAGALVALLAALVTLNVSGLRDRLGLRSRTPRIESLGVLPLENLSGDKEQEYFADGMTDELISQLARVGGIRVISRTSVTQYKGTKKSIPQIGRELHVDALMEGSVLRSGNRVRITLQLIRAATDAHMWSQSYERDLQDVLALQNDVARDVADQVDLRLAPAQRAQLARSRLVNREAYDTYLRGRHSLNRVTSEQDIQTSIKEFQRAIAQDPGAAFGYAGLADSYVALADFYKAPREVLPKAEGFAQKALELDPNLSEAHVSLGWVKLVYEWNWSAAQREFDRAIELNPGNAVAHDDKASYFSSLGDHTAASAESQHALELDSFSLVFNANSGFDSLVARRYDRAIEQEQRALDLEVNCHICRAYMALAYAARGQLPQALAEARRVRQAGANPLDLATTGSVFGLAGARAEAEKLLEELKQVMEQRFVCPYEIATTYLGLGQKDEAFRWFEKAYEARSVCMIWLKVDPRIDPVRSDPRLIDLLRRVGFPP